MSLSPRIQDQFQASMQAARDAQSVLVEPIEQAVQVLTECLMGAGKILVCGQGVAGLAAQHLATALADRFAQDRPGLAAIALARDGASVMDDAHPGLGLGRQVAALGHPGDILVALSVFGGADGVRDAVRVAHERDMRVLVLAGGDGGPLARILREQDVLICIPSSSVPRVVEAQFLVIHCLCDGIDFFLLGA
ncbi:MAG TPA: SIS domain-containing protein [Thiobacillaceae bacterium]|nr:SIS domain-containing protein [Thiobacillaceae bacterium]HNU64886.1 SIS domain-containing protein [Thiobacillaceae bacterium]